MKHLSLLFCLLVSLHSYSRTHPDDIVIENEQMKLVVGNDGITQSLLYKPTGEECLMQGERIPLFSVTQERPYHNEIKLAYPTQQMTFQAKSVSRDGEDLIVAFELIYYKARIKVGITPQYINFTVTDFFVEESDYGLGVNTGIKPPVLEMNFWQLPIRNKTYFGEWLNVCWDKNSAVNLLASDIHARIRAEKREGFRILTASVERDIRLLGVSAALIVCQTDHLLDQIAQVEEDFDLPRGVESRRHPLYTASYYAASDITPANVDEHLKYAKMGGFKGIKFSDYDIVESGPSWSLMGNYDWRTHYYPNGQADLKKVLQKINKEGIVTGFHFLHSHIGRDSRYVTPVPDHRLNLLKQFTLAAPLGINDTQVVVEQNPANLTLADGMRVLKIGTELISYRNYTTTRPYTFTGCVRGIDKTTPAPQSAGVSLGLLDVSEFGSQRSVYVDQKTSLQDEVGVKLANIYNAGFDFCYFDGSEGVNQPFWFNVPYAQWRVYDQFDRKPLFAEGAAKSHFSWHMLSGGNAFDVFSPETLKDEIKKWPAQQAKRMKEDFSRVNFGWLGYFVPHEKSIGTQPDMIEFVTGLAAAWDCPISLNGHLPSFKAHARTADNLEVFRRWEEVRARKWLSEEQKEMLRKGEREYLLLLDEQKRFELQPYEQILNVANNSREIRAFVFERKDEQYVVYWHISANKRLELPIRSSKVFLYKEMGEKENGLQKTKHTIVVPAGNRRYLKLNGLTKEQIVKIFADARIIE